MASDPEQLRTLLLELGEHLRDAVIAARTSSAHRSLTEVVDEVEADVIYGIDRVGDDAVLEWFAERWSADEPVRLVMEGIDDHRMVTFPPNTGLADLVWTCVIDPIDGTRNLMFDKRPAWVLTAIAPGAGAHLGLQDIVVAAMVEIPVVKQWRADQYSAVRGRGLVATGQDVRSGARVALHDRPTSSSELTHGFASFAHALPDAKALLASIDEDLWELLIPPGPRGRAVFEDQYLCSAGQIHDVMTGRDRLVGDLRPLALAQLGLDGPPVAHPYDVCTGLLLIEAGGILEDPWGRPLRSPLDTTSAVTWVAYANPALAAAVRPALDTVLRRRLDPHVLESFGAPGRT